MTSIFLTSLFLLSTINDSVSFSTPARPLVLVPLGTGTEELELASITDVLNRFGCLVTTASVMPCCSPTPKPFKMSNGLTVLPDAHISSCLSTPYDAVVLPGGIPGAEHLRDSDDLLGILRRQKSTGRIIGAVCASPAVVLGTHGLLPAAATCYPSPLFQSVLTSFGATPSSLSSPVVSSSCGKIITSRGPATAIEFALAIGGKLCGEEKMREVKGGMLA